MEEKAYLRKLGKIYFLDFYNSQEVYSIKAFESERKALNYAKKYAIKLTDKKPDTIKEFEYHD